MANDRLTFEFEGGTWPAFTTESREQILVHIGMRIESFARGKAVAYEWGPDDNKRLDAIWIEGGEEKRAVIGRIRD